MSGEVWCAGTTPSQHLHRPACSRRLLPGLLTRPSSASPLRDERCVPPTQGAARLLVRVSSLRPPPVESSRQHPPSRSAGPAHGWGPAPEPGTPPGSSPGSVAGRVGWGGRGVCGSYLAERGSRCIEKNRTGRCGGRAAVPSDEHCPKSSTRCKAAPLTAALAAPALVLAASWVPYGPPSRLPKAWHSRRHGIAWLPLCCAAWFHSAGRLQSPAPSALVAGIRPQRGSTASPTVESMPLQRGCCP